MFTPINPQGEEMRAQAIVDSLTDYNKAVKVFAPRNAQGETAEREANANRSYGESIMRVFQAIKLNRRPVVDEPVQQPIGSPRQVTTTG